MQMPLIGKKSSKPVKTIEGLWLRLRDRRGECLLEPYLRYRYQEKEKESTEAYNKNRVYPVSQSETISKHGMSIVP